MRFQADLTKIIAMSIITGLFVGSLSVLPTLQNAFAATVNVSIVPGAATKTTDAFSPNPANANVGDTVIWQNNDTILHCIASGTSASGPTGQFGCTVNNIISIPPGKTFQHTFNQAGTYPYYCYLHPQMAGQVKVGSSTTGTSIAINNVGKTEGDSGTKSFTFKITRTGVLTGASSLKYATASGTAISGSDFVAKSGTVSFAADETLKYVTVSVKGDTAIEPDEKFKVNLSSCVGCSFSDNRGVGTIRNDDP